MSFNELFGYVDLESFINIVKVKTGLRLNIAAIERHRSNNFFVVGLMYEGYFSPLPSYVKITDTETKVLYTDCRLLPAKDDERYRFIVNDEFSLDVGDERQPYSFIEDDLVILVSHADTFVNWLLSKKIAEDDDKQVVVNSEQENKLDENEDKPAPVNSKKENKLDENEDKPAPVNSEKENKLDENEDKPAPVNSEKENKLDENEDKPVPVNSEKENKLDENEDKLAPANSEKENKLDENEDKPAPVNSEKENKLDENEDKPAPVNSEKENKLDENEDKPAPANSEKENKLDENEDKPVPANSEKENKQDENEVKQALISLPNEDKTDERLIQPQLSVAQRRGGYSEFIIPIANAYLIANYRFPSDNQLLIELKKKENIDEYGYIINVEKKLIEVGTRGRKVDLSILFKNYNRIINTPTL